MKKTHEFAPGDRYHYDYLLCPKDYAQVDTREDASYFGIWANPRTFVVFSYIEGDCTTVEYNDVVEFIIGIRELKKFYGEDFIGIDPGLSVGADEPWKNLGLGDLLH